MVSEMIIGGVISDTSAMLAIFKTAKVIVIILLGLLVLVLTEQGKYGSHK